PMSAVELCRRLRVSLPAAAVVLVTAFDRSDEIRRCLAAGADGCLLKDTSEVDMTVALRMILTGGRAIDPRIAFPLVRGLAGQPDGKRQSVTNTDHLFLLGSNPLVPQEYLALNRGRAKPRSVLRATVSSPCSMDASPRPACGRCARRIGRSGTTAGAAQSPGRAECPRARGSPRPVRRPSRPAVGAWHRSWVNSGTNWSASRSRTQAQSGSPVSGMSQ